MKKCIIIPYFGKFPNTIEAFIMSCKNNSEFDWLIFTDDKIKELPENVTIVYTSLCEMKKLIENKLGFEINLSAPYKLCDYRPAFGVIFEDYLKTYDFWGYGDIDLIYGKLSQFITDDILRKYDKIYPCGHLSLIRNIKVYNEAFKEQVEGTLDYREVFTNDKSFIFDEYQGINEKILALGGKIYDSFDFADMDIIYKRFRTSDKRTLSKVFPQYLFKNNVPLNYKKQLFVIENGRAFRVFIKNRKIEKKEIVYIHYRHKIDSFLKDGESNRYLITNKGFWEYEATITETTFEDFNKYEGYLFELKEFFKFYKNYLIVKLGKNKRIRNFIRLLKGKEKINE